MADSETVLKIASSYVENVRRQLEGTWKGLTLDIGDPEVHEVTGGLLARQVSLATQLASSPGTWNAHIAPLVLRSMVEVHITLAWIFLAPVDRTREFLKHGIGQEKLILEHHKSALVAKGKDPEKDAHVQNWEKWINSQQYTFLTEVNVGSWSGSDLREMADKVGCSEMYRHAYTPFSCATHSMWNHISKYNFRVCENSLHRFHRVPADPDLDIDLDYLYRAAKYCEKSFVLFREKANVKAGTPSAFELLVKELDQLGDSADHP